MAHSTTATSTYALAKYSKSYPTGPQPNPESNNAEWQHFTNPSIRLVLDIRKGADLESVRLRILWSMDSDQREEDIDLLTLSCLPQRPVQKQQTQGLPLKAVYRDTVVGIRYLHPIDITNAQTYRRFQITFLSSVSVLEFITAISTVCPCKANPSPNQVPRTMNPPLAPINIPNSQNQLHGSNAYAPADGTLPASISAAVQQPRYNRQVPFASSPSAAFKSPVQPNFYSSSPLRMETSDLQLPSSSAARPTVQMPGFNVPANDNLIGPATHPRPLSQLPANPRLQDLQQQTSLPNSSSPTSSAKSTSNTYNGSSLPSSTIGEDVPVDSASAILASLRESTSLYDLPRDRLQQLIGDVVREEGFAKLLENINSMWSVKSFVGI